MARRWLLLLALAVAWTAAPGAPAPLDRIELPPGFAIGLWGGAPGARALAVLPGSDAVVVGTRSDTLWLLRDTDGDHRADERRALARGLAEPHGVAFHDGRLYVAERHRILRAAFDPERGTLAPWELVRGGLPDDSYHGTRDLAFGPDGRLYVSIGSPCDVCLPEPPADAILSMEPDGRGEIVFATGIRNAVGLAFHPATGGLLFTDNGVDGLGPTRPPDELNVAPRAGLFFGFPWFGGGRERTPEFADRALPADPTFPALELEAHGAALGLHVYAGDAFPPDYRHDVFIAQHGASGRETRAGFRVLRVRLDATGEPVGREVFARGWLQADGAWGRPVDVAELDDGSLLVSDDEAGAIYRIHHRGAAPRL